MPRSRRRIRFPVRAAACVIGVLLSIPADIPSQASVPESRSSFASADGRYELRRTTPADGRRESWDLVDRETDEVHFTIEAPLSYKSVYVTDDGASLAVLDVFCSGEPDLDHVVLEFFRNGRQVRNYALRDLVPDARYLAFSFRGWLWFAERFPGWPADRSTIFDPDGTLALTTLDLRRHVFDVATGERTDVACSPLIPAGAAAHSGAVRLVTPAIPGVTPRRFEVVPRCPLCGAPPSESPIPFEVPDSFEPPFRLEWFVDPTLLPNTVHEATVFLREGKIVGALDHALSRCD